MGKNRNVTKEITKEITKENRKDYKKYHQNKTFYFLLIIFRYADIMDREEEEAMVERLLKKRNMTKYRLAVEAGIPHATLNDICSGKTRLEKCSAETVYK